DEVRAGHQPQDREGARPDDPAVAAAAGGRGDPVVHRRAFLGGTSAVLLAAPLAAWAQQPPKVPKIGVLTLNTPVVLPGVEFFWGRMRELGWVEGQNVVVERRG